jgi:hypothetical protein
MLTNVAVLLEALHAKRFNGLAIVVCAAVVKMSISALRRVTTVSHISCAKPMTITQTHIVS